MISGRDRDLPLQLSQSAIKQGWTGIAKGPPSIDDSAEVEGFSREDFYERRGFWQLAAEPLLRRFLSGLFIRKELITEWKDLAIEITESESSVNYHIDSRA